MYDLNDMVVFVKVAEAGSFTRAATHLAMPVSSVSTRVARLEARLKMRLLERTTRRLRLTEAGQRYLLRAQAALRELEAGQAEVAALHSSPRGHLRLSVAPVLAQVVLPGLLARFLALYPQVTVEVEATSRRADLLKEGIDVCIRVGELKDSRLVHKAVGQTAAGLYAAPGLFSARAPPQRPSQLTDWPLVEHGFGSETVHWHLTSRTGTEKPHELSFSPRLSSNEHEVLLAALRARQGIGNLPRFIGNPRVAAGELVAVLPDWDVRQVAISLLYPSHKSLSPALRAFIDLAFEGLRAALDPVPPRPTSPRGPRTT